MRIIKIASRSRILDTFMAGGTSVSSTLTVPNLYQTLRFLQIMDQYNSRTVINDDASLNAFLGSSGVDIASYSIFLSQLAAIYAAMSSSTVIRSLFSPFTDLLRVIDAKPGLSASPIPLPSLIADSVTIVNYGSGSYYGTRTQQYPMFERLYNEFKTKVASAATASGKTSLASAVTGGALFNYISLFAAAGKDLGKPQPAMYTISDQIISDIMKKRFDTTKYTNQNIEIIKEKFMHTFGAITEQQRKQVEKERKTINVTQQQWLNPYFLTSLLIFFMQYRKAVSVLPD